jgi:hypothetical protein
MSIVALALAVAVQTLGLTAGSAPLDCGYAPSEGGGFTTFSHCAWNDARGQVHFTRQHLKRMAYDERGLASVYVSGWRYVLRNGRSAAVMTFDNGADPFVNGLARSPNGKKVGYIDRSLSAVIPARFDGAYPFENGLAVVCNGCRIVSDGEHSSYADGTWACIDRRGRFVVAPHAARDYAPCSRSNN